MLTLQEIESNESEGNFKNNNILYMVKSRLLFLIENYEDNTLQC